MIAADWLWIKGYEGRYKISIYGEIKRVDSTRWTRPLVKSIKKGKECIKLTRFNGVREWYLVHHLVAGAFLPPKPGLKHVLRHINGSKCDNFYMNLEWVTREQLGKDTGAKSRRRAVSKSTADGEVISLYPSAREAGRQNYMSYQTVMDRCNVKCKSKTAPDGFVYQWADNLELQEGANSYDTTK
jgi:hypothetical protein